nr:mediator of RNA polymerase II transcription subunit 15a-like [Populus alba]
MKYLDYPDCNKSTEKLDLIKRQINCVFQFAMPRKPASSLVHGQLTPNLHPLQKSLQPHPQIHQAMPPEDQKKPPLQSMNPRSSAINLQDSNMRTFGDNSLQYPSKLVISQQDDIKSEQHLCESNSERENVVNPVPQVSMRSLQLPLSTLPQPNDIKFLLKNHRNERAKANSRRSSSVAQRMDPKQTKSLHHVSAQKKNQESQQSQMCQQLIKGNQEVPQQMQEDDEMPHQLNEVNDVKMTQGIEHETALNQIPEVKNLKFRQVTAVKSGVPPSISSPRHIQTEPVRLPRHFPLTNQHNMLRLQTIVGSPSHSVNSQPGFSAEFLSNDSSYLNTDGFGFDASTINFGESCDAEKPILRLIKAVNSISSKALSASVSEFRSVVNLADSMAGSVPVYGSKGSVSEDLGVTSKTNSVGRYFSMGCSTFGMRKVKRSTKAVPLNDKTPACPEKSDSESTTFCPNKKPRIQVSRAVLKEIEEINQQLIDTVLDISDEETDSTTAGPDGGGIIIKCSFIAVSISPNFNSKDDFDQISKIQPLKLLVPTKYPYCSPIVLEKLPEEVSEKHDDLSVKARVKLNLHLRSLLQPMSIGEMARTWDKCARTATSEHAVKNGGGCVFSKYGTWENCFSAA